MPKSLHHCCRIYCSLDAEITALLIAENTALLDAVNIVGEKIGLDFTLTLKVARHSFAILALQDSMSISLVSRMLGHSTTDTTESYYSEYLPHTMKEELDSLGYNFIPEM